MTFSPAEASRCVPHLRLHLLHLAQADPDRNPSLASSRNSDGQTMSTLLRGLALSPALRRRPTPPPSPPLASPSSSAGSPGRRPHATHTATSLSTSVPPASFSLSRATTMLTCPLPILVLQAAGGVTALAEARQRKAEAAVDHVSAVADGRAAPDAQGALALAAEHSKVDLEVRTAFLFRKQSRV